MAKRPTARQLANPGERSKIPTNMLPPKYRAARLRREAMERKNSSALYQPTVPLAGRDLRDTINQLVETTTRPQLNALEREGRNITTQGNALQGKSQDLYRQIAQREAGNMDRQRALTARARANLGGIDAGNQAAVAARAAESQAVMPQTGLQGSAGERLASEGQALGARAAQQGANYRSLNEVQGANFEGLQGAMASATQMRGGELQERLANRMMNKTLENEGEQQSIRSGRGALAAKFLVGADGTGGLRQQGFDNAVIGQEYKLKVAGAQADAAGAAARLEADATAEATKADNDFLLKTGMTRDDYLALDPEARRGVLERVKAAGKARPKGPSASDRKAQFELDFAEKNGFFPPTGPPKETAPAGAGPAKDDARSKAFRSAITNDRLEFRRLMKKVKAKGPAKERRVKQLMLEAGTPIEAYNIVYDLERRKKINPINAAKARSNGYFLPPGWRG